MDVKIDVRDDNNFITHWHDGPHDVRMIATKGQGTTLGLSRADIRPWDNGQLLNTEIMDCVLAHSLLAIKGRIEELKWGKEPRTQIPTSPRIPLWENPSDVLIALCEACADDLVTGTPNRPRTFDAPMPDAHVHIINNQPMLDAFTRAGARPRLFGNKPMMPGVNVLGF